MKERLIARKLSFGDATRDVARGHAAGPPGKGAIYVTYDRGDSWEKVALQKRGTEWLQPPAIRVLWAAAEN